MQKNITIQEKIFKNKSFGLSFVKKFPAMSNTCKYCECYNFNIKENERELEKQNSSWMDPLGTNLMIQEENMIKDLY